MWRGLSVRVTGRQTRESLLLKNTGKRKTAASPFDKLRAPRSDELISRSSRIRQSADAAIFQFPRAPQASLR